MDEQNNVKQFKRGGAGGMHGPNIRELQRAVGEAGMETGRHQTMVKKFGALGAAMRANRAERNKPKEDQPKHMTGIFFWIVASLSIVKDALDVPADLTFFLSIVASILSFTITGIIIFYLFSQGIPKETKQLAYMITGLSAVIEFIPLINILPAGALNLFIIRALANNPALKEIAEKATGQNIKTPRSNNRGKIAKYA